MTHIKCYGSRSAAPAAMLSWGIAAAAVTVSIATTAVAAEPAPDPTFADHAAGVLRALGEQAHQARLANSWGGIVLGSAALGAGLLADLEYEQSYGEIIWIAGAFSLGGGLVGLFIPSPMERFAREAGPGSASYSPAYLEQTWRTQAEEARGVRKVAGIVNLAIGGAAIVTGAALAAGAGDLERSEESDWATVAFVGGGLFAGAGLATLLMKSEMERGYELAYPSMSRAAAPFVNVSFAPVRSGGALHLSGAF